MSDIDRLPKFSEDFTGNNVSTLLCPSCGKPWLHQTAVSVFARHKEDAERGQHVDVRYGDGEVVISENVKSSDGNPSSRRDGIRIQFSCEQCSALEPSFELVIEQHKGNEFIHWEKVND